MNERRYTEDEVAAIFADATQAHELRRRPTHPASGMTLAELQEIGREVGIAPEAVAHAAHALERRNAPPAMRRFLGLPLGVGRTVELGRRLSDEDWERLVVDLRDTFDARGHVREHGSFRQWTNGNLQALLEPSTEGHRLRLRTVKGNARAMLLGGLGLLGASVAMAIPALVTGNVNDPDALVALATMGAGLIGAAAIQLPGWARTRLRQMDAVIARLSKPEA